MGRAFACRRVVVLPSPTLHYHFVQWWLQIITRLFLFLLLFLPNNFVLFFQPILKSTCISLLFLKFMFLTLQDKLYIHFISLLKCLHMHILLFSQPLVIRIAGVDLMFDSIFIFFLNLWKFLNNDSFIKLTFKLFLYLPFLKGRLVVSCALILWEKLFFIFYLFIKWRELR